MCKIIAGYKIKIQLHYAHSLLSWARLDGKSYRNGLLLAAVMLAQFTLNATALGLIISRHSLFLQYNTVNNISGNQIQLSVFSIKILGGKGNHREIPANTPFYKHKYFGCVNTHWSCSSPLFLHLDQNISCFLVFLRAVQRPELDCWNRGN